MAVISKIAFLPFLPRHILWAILKKIDYFTLRKCPKTCKWLSNFLVSQMARKYKTITLKKVRLNHKTHELFFSDVSKSECFFRRRNLFSQPFLSGSSYIPEKWLRGMHAKYVFLELNFFMFSMDNRGILKMIQELCATVNIKSIQVLCLPKVGAAHMVSLLTELQPLNVNVAGAFDLNGTVSEDLIDLFGRITEYAFISESQEGIRLWLSDIEKFKEYIIACRDAAACIPEQYICGDVVPSQVRLFNFTLAMIAPKQLVPIKRNDAYGARMVRLQHGVLVVAYRDTFFTVKTFATEDDAKQAYQQFGYKLMDINEEPYREWLDEQCR